MKKLYATGEKGIITELEQKAKDKPMPVKLEPFQPNGVYGNRVKTALLSSRYDEIFLEEDRQEWLATVPTKFREKAELASKANSDRELSPQGKAHRTKKRNQAIRAMITDRVWCQELADEYAIDMHDITNHHSLHLYISVYLNHAIDRHFKEYLASCAVECYAIERKKKLGFLAQSKIEPSDPTNFLRKAIKVNKFKRENRIPPRLIIEETLFSNSGGYSHLQFLEDQLETYKHRKSMYTTSTVDGVRGWFCEGSRITQHEYKAKTKEYIDKIKKLQKRNETLLKALFLDKESNDNMVFIKAAGIRELEDHFSKMDQEKFENEEYISGRFGMTTIKVSSIAQGESLLNEYVKWYNERFVEEIARDKALEDAVANKKRMDERLAEAKSEREQRDARIVEAYINGLNNAQIAESTGIPVKTVGDVLVRYRRVVELFEQGVTDPEQISEMTTTRLASVCDYITFHTNETVDVSSLSEQQLEQLMQEEEELRIARDRILDREVKYLQKKLEDKCRLEREKPLLEMHHKGLTASGISKLTKLTRGTVVRILKQHGLKPKFELKWATPEEIEEWKAQQEQIDKARPQIDFSPNDIVRFREYEEVKKTIRQTSGKQEVKTSQSGAENKPKGKS